MNKLPLRKTVKIIHWPLAIRSDNQIIHLKLNSTLQIQIRNKQNTNKYIINMQFQMWEPVNFREHKPYWVVFTEATKRFPSRDWHVE